MEELGITSNSETLVESKLSNIKTYGSLLSELNKDILSKESGNSLYGNNTNSDIYLKLKKLEKEYELLTLQEDYIKDEQRHLKRELLRAQEEVKRIQSVPLVIGQFLEPIDENTGIVG